MRKREADVRGGVCRSCPKSPTAGLHAADFPNHKFLLPNLNKPKPQTPNHSSISRNHTARGTIVASASTQCHFQQHSRHKKSKQHSLSTTCPVPFWLQHSESKYERVPLTLTSTRRGHIYTHIYIYVYEYIHVSIYIYVDVYVYVCVCITCND